MKGRAQPAQGAPRPRRVLFWLLFCLCSAAIFRKGRRAWLRGLQWTAAAPSRAPARRLACRPAAQPVGAQRRRATCHSAAGDGARRRARHFPRTLAAAYRIIPAVLRPSKCGLRFYASQLPRSAPLRRPRRALARLWRCPTWSCPLKRRRATSTPRARLARGPPAQRARRVGRCCPPASLRLGVRPRWACGYCCAAAGAHPG
jgi:hypothetical protein